MRNALQLICAATPLAVCAAGAPCQTKTTAAAPNKTSKSAARGVKGTAQMAGDNGKIGVTYTVGKGRSAINFTLLSAEFVPTRIVLKDDIYVAKATEKYLVLHYTLQNPQHEAYEVGDHFVCFTAVDGHELTHETTRDSACLFINPDTREQIQMSLKPGQKIAVESAISVPANDQVPKLIVRQFNGGPVLRIYLGPPEVKGVPPPWASTEIPGGYTALPDSTAVAPGSYVAVDCFDVKLVACAYRGKFAGYDPDVDNWFCVATFTARNATTTKQPFQGTVFCSAARTDDGHRTATYRNDMLDARRDRPIDVELGPGEEATFRVLIPVPSGAKAKEVRLSQKEDSHVAVFGTAGATGSTSSGTTSGTSGTTNGTSGTTGSSSGTTNGTSGTSSGASGATLKVPEQYARIQDAIDHAKTGDVIVVGPGTYHESITIQDKGIRLTSTRPRDLKVVAATTIAAVKDQGAAVTFQGSCTGAVLAGFTITNGFYEIGGGVHAEQNPHHVLICNNIITDNWGAYGGGIGMNGDPIIRDYIITNNSAHDGGGIALVSNTGVPRVEANTLYHNTATSSGGGIYLSNNKLPALIENNIIVESGKAGGIRLDHGCKEPQVDFCDFYDDVGGDTSWHIPDNSNILADPLFVDPDNGDFHLRANSPCIGKGRGGRNIGALGVKRPAAKQETTRRSAAPGR